MCRMAIKVKNMAKFKGHLHFSLGERPGEKSKIKERAGLRRLLGSSRRIELVALFLFLKFLPSS